MNQHALVLCALVCLATNAPAESFAAQTTVTICLDGNLDPGLRRRVLATASEMYASIGIAIDWRTGSRPCPAGAIKVELSERPPYSVDPDALGLSHPYEGVHVELYLNRIRDEAEPHLLPALLAHVLVHETAHTLQGVVRHSETGIMKAMFTRRDFMQMTQRPLPFTKLDADLIHRGIPQRAERLAFAANQTLATLHFGQ